MNKITIVKKGVTFGILNNIIATIIPFISRTIIIYVIGTEYLGLSSLFTSIINVLNITELGFGAAISSLLYEPIALKDDSKVCSILSFTKKSFRIIGIIIFILGILIIPILPNLISSNYPHDINIYILYIIYLLNTVISYLGFSYKRVLFSALQRYDIEMNIGTVSLLIQGILQVLGLLIFKNYYLYSIILIIGTLLNNLLCGYYSKKLYPQFYCKGGISKKEIKKISMKISGAFFSKIGSTIYFSADNIVISAFFGLKTLGMYGNYYYVISTLVSLFAVLHNTLRPILGQNAVLQDKKDTFNGFIQLNYLYMLLTIVCTSCLICLFQDFIKIWAGVENLLSIDLVLLLGIYFFCGRLFSIPLLYIESLGLWWESKYISLISGILNLIVNIILSSFLGLAGVLISSILCSFINFIGYNKVIFKNYFTQIGYFKIYLKSSLKIYIQAIIIFLITYSLAKYFIINGFIELLCKGIFIFLISIILILLFNFKIIKENKNKIITLIRTRRQ